MKFLEYLNDHIVCLDGGCGTYLQQRGLQPGESPEPWNVSHGEVITGMHKAYYDAGSNVVFTNTFGANGLKYGDEELEAIVTAAVANAKAARDQSKTPQEKFVALDIGPLGKLLKPYGDLDFEDAVTAFAKTVRFGAAAGVDLVVVETMADSYETKAAVLAVKENCDLPVLVTNAYGQSGNLMTGATPEAMVAMLEGLGVDLLGANCSLGPKQLRSVVERLLAVASVPVVLKPNAGLPRLEDGKTVFDVTVEEFVDEVVDMVNGGVRAVGGCCGTNPDYLAQLSQKVQGIVPKSVSDKARTVISSYNHAVCFGEDEATIGSCTEDGESIRASLVDGDVEDIVDAALDLQDEVEIMHLNVDLPEVDVAAVLKEAVCEVQAVSGQPLQLETAHAAALEAALRRYNGKAMVKCAAEDVEKLLPIVKKYGAVVAVPAAAEAAVLAAAEKVGMQKKDFLFS